MTGIVSLPEGATLPLILSMPDGKEDLYPRASILDAAGASVGTVDMVHNTGGLYLGSGAPVLMPNSAWVSITYTIYTDVGRTVESYRYHRFTEVITKSTVSDDVDLSPVLNAISGLNDVTAADVRAAFVASDFHDKNTEVEFHTWLDSYVNKANWKTGAQDVADAVWNDLE